MSDIDWNSALKGWAVKFCHDGPGARWFVSKPSGYSNVVTCREVDNHVVSDLLDQMARASIATPTEPSPWTGDGLPPVGTVCEAEFHEDRSGRTVQIAAYFKRHVWFVDEEDGCQIVRPIDRMTFHCIPTPEQIAEEERKAAGLELGELYVKGGLIAIYDAGWLPRAKS